MNTVHTLRRAGLVALFCLAVVVGSLATALAKQGSTPPTPRRPHAYDAIVLCNPGIAEDSAAHVRLVQFEHAPEGWVLVYRCKHTGY
jgi:hypothetical protein